MADDWIKISHNLPEKPEVFAMSRAVGQSRAEITLALIKFWRWADKNTTDGTNLSVTSDEVDEIVGLTGFVTAMRSVGWIEGRDNSLQVPKFERHNGNSAKARALEAEAKRLRRLSDNASDIVRQNTPEMSDQTRGDERRREDPSASPGARTDRRVREDSPPAPNDPSPKNDSRKGKEPPLDLSEVVWDHVCAMAHAIGKRIPPATEDDRRQWLKFAVMAQMTFSEAWLRDAAEAVVVGKSRRSRQAHFVAVLKSKADEQGVDADLFKSILRRIEIPSEVWKSNCLRKD